MDRTCSTAKGFKTTFLQIDFLRGHVMNHGQTENSHILPSIGFKDLLNAYAS